MTTGEHLPPVNPLTQASAEVLLARMSDMFAISDLEVPSHVIVEPTTENGSADQFPAHTTWGRGEGLVLSYNDQAVRDMAERHDEDPEIFRLVERVYLSGGIALGILSKRIDALDAEKVNLLYNAFKSTDFVNRMVYQDESLEEEDRLGLNLALVSSEEQRQLRIGVQRFVIGLCQMLEAETAGLEMLTKHAQFDLADGLNYKQKTWKLFLALRLNEDDAALRAEENFREQVPELTIALCYPMEFDEMQLIMSIVTMKGATDDYGYQAESVAEVPEYGFHEEGGPV